MFNHYFTMTEEQAIMYTERKLDFFEPTEPLICKEIGDGNLNYIFRIVSQRTGRSIIIKQSGPVARISDQFKLSPDRNRIEFEILDLHDQLAPGLVPKVYHYDPIMHLTVMDDLSDHVIMRSEMLAHKAFPRFVEDITDYMVNTLLLTSDVCMDHQQKKALVKNYINPELCAISEDLVFTEPFDDFNRRNDVFPPNLAWVKENLYADEVLKLEVAKLKFEFMNNAQALIHGDLHTGSIFVKEDSTKIIDPEFAFYGPMGYDVGNIIANLLFAWANASAYKMSAQKKWLEETIVSVIDVFKEKFINKWHTHVTERTAMYPGFMAYYLDQVIHDTSAVTGLEGIRRIVGIAHVKDMTQITPEDARAFAERLVMTMSKRFILDRHQLSSGADFLHLIKTVEQTMTGVPHD